MTDLARVQNILAVIKYNERMWIWVVLTFACLGIDIAVDNLGLIARGSFSMPIDMRLPAIVFMVLHLFSEKVAVWEDESLWIALALVTTIADFFVSFDLTTNIGFWFVAFHILQHGGFRGSV